MKKSTLTDEKIIGILKQAGAGIPIRGLCCTAGSSDSTFYGWRVKLGGMQVSEVQRLLTEAPMNVHASWRFVVNAGRCHDAKIRTSTASCGTPEVLNSPR